MFNWIFQRMDFSRFIVQGIDGGVESARFTAGDRSCDQDQSCRFGDHAADDFKLVRVVTEFGEGSSPSYRVEESDGDVLTKERRERAQQAFESSNDSIHTRLQRKESKVVGQTVFATDILRFVGLEITNVAKTKLQ